MKNISYFKEAMLQLTFASTIILMSSCSFSQNPDETKVASEEHNNAKLVSNQQEKDAQFLINAAEMSLKEIQFAKLAQQKGNTAYVRELGEMMEEENSKSLSDLTALAKSKMITIPTSPSDHTQDAYRELNEKSGDDFDRAYADMMVSGHKDAITAFEKASTDGNDTDIRNWAAGTLPNLHTHLDQSIGCQKNVLKYN